MEAKMKQAFFSDRDFHRAGFQNLLTACHAAPPLSVI
jgi:hypothetical protein